MTQPRSQPQLLGDRYELEGVVGRGGMAEVYRARDLRLDRIVAIKTLRPDLARDQTFQARFRREAQSAASLNHPSIVAVYDTGEDMSTGNPIPYIVMEYVDGRTVRDLLIDGHRLLPERSLEIVSGVLKALEYSHQAGIVHRDIKPGNVMVTRNGDIKVMDFGIARAMSDAQATMTQTAQVIGTAQYLSPEQARGERVDARSDLYSAGCLMYELLTGRPPFTGDSPVAIAYQHVRENPIPPSRLDPDIPPWADAIVLKAMAKPPGDRYQSAAEMQADIQRAASGMQVAAMAAPPTRAEYYDYEYEYPQERTQRMGASTMMAGAATGQYPPRTGGYSGQSYGGDGGYPPERKSWARRWLPWLIPAAVIIAVIAVAAAMLSGGGQTYFVPSVDGSSQQSAVTQMTQAGFDNVKIVPQSNGTVQKGIVISTSPANGQSVSSRTTQVKIYVSTGVGKVAVPNVVNMSQNAATTALQSAHLNYNVQSDPTSTVAQGTVTKQNPAANAQVSPGQVVTIYVSGGPVTVPSVIGDTNYLHAEQVLQNAGLQVNAQQRAAQASQPVTSGEVWSETLADGTTPAGGTTQPRGTTITIFYEPQQATQSPSPSTTPSDSTSPSPTDTPSPTTSPSPSTTPTNGGGPGGGAVGNGVF
jgi:beta-lactam-binding protein with PASTA domain/tRNA A-37 threonylcarbamoyl transferase component Bud32